MVLAIGVIWVLTGCFVISAVTGIEKGVQFLSNANAIAAALLVLFLFVVGPTVFILSTFTESMGGYLTYLPTMASGPERSAAPSWINGWTVFYWAWWISWTPFVGMFIARISKGRTIRQFVIYVVLVPSLVSFVWFSIMGGAAYDLQLNQGVPLDKVAGRPGHRERAVRDAPGVPVVLHHRGARDPAHRDLLHHRRRLRVDRHGHAQPARQGGAEAVAHRVLGRGPGRGRLGAAVVRRRDLRLG